MRLTQPRDYSNSCSGAVRAPNPASLNRRKPPLRLFLSRVTADQLALCDHMTLHRGIHLAPLRTRPQIEFAIEGENLERIPMCAWRRTRTLVTRFAEVICALHAF